MHYVNVLLITFIELSTILFQEIYYDVAERFQPHSFFYAASHDLVKRVRYDFY